MNESLEEAYSHIHDGDDVPDNFCGLPRRYCNFDNSRFVILPVPFEGTISYGSGASDGPEAIIDASRNVELYDVETCLSPFVHGIYTAPPIEVRTVAEVIAKTKSWVENILAAGKMPIVLGGEHTVSLGAIQAAANRGTIGVLQLDAHTDLRDEYDSNRFSHACVMRRALEHDGVAHLSQAGIRSSSYFERNALNSPRVTTVLSKDFCVSLVDKLLEPLPDDIYITIDVDVFDPSIMPATGTPEPGGLLWRDVLNLLEEAFRKHNVVGFDIVELAPIDGLHHPQFTAASLIYKMMGLAAKYEEPLF